MKSINLKALWMLLALIVLSSVSSSCATPLPPQLEYRTIWFKKNKDNEVIGFYYPYKICVRKIFGICTKEKMTEDLYLFTEQDKMKIFYEKRFVLKMMNNI